MTCEPGCPYCGEEPPVCVSAARRIHDFIRGWDAARRARQRDNHHEGDTP